MIQAKRPTSRQRVTHLGRQIVQYRWLYLMLLPAMLYYIFFKFMPIYGLRIAFMDYIPGIGQVGSNAWYHNFEVFFKSADFRKLMVNTFSLAIYNICLYFPVPLLLALLLNEIRSDAYKRTVQSLVYLPHFLSWAVIASLVLILFGPAPRGLLNNFLQVNGMQQIPITYSTGWFRPLYIMELIWKEAGWGTIIYLAALSGVDEQLYEAAVIDGASRFQQLLHITLPSIKSTIVILLILRMGQFLESGFDQIYLMVNSLNREVATVFDTYIYEVGLLGSKTPPGVRAFSYSAAVGLFRSVISLVLVLATDRIAKWLGEEGLY